MAIRKIQFKDLNEVNFGLNKLSQLPLAKLGDMANAMAISKSKDALNDAFKKAKVVYSKDSKELQAEYSNLDEPINDAEGNWNGSYKWKEGVDREEYMDKSDALAARLVEVDLPDIYIPGESTSWISLSILEWLFKAYGNDIVRGDFAAETKEA